MRLIWLADIKLKGPRLPGSILLLGGPFKLGQFKYCRRGYFKIGWQKLNGSGLGPWINIIVGVHLN